MKKNAANDFIKGIKGKGTMADLKQHTECFEKLDLRFSFTFMPFINVVVLCYENDTIII